MFEALASMIAGLGLFFLGLQMLTENVQKLSGRKFRRTIIAHTNKTLSGVLWGGIVRCFTSSTTITTFILISLLIPGSITVRQALPVLIGSNMGGASIVYLTSLNIKLIVLLMIGVTGLLLTSERAVKFRIATGALLGVGLLFFGLNLVQSSATPMANEAWFKTLLQKTHQAYALAYLIGGLLSFLSQSTAAISILAITMTKSGLLTIDQTIMVIYGCHIGSSLTTYLLSLKLDGRPRQIAMFQTNFNIVGAIVLLPLFYLEIYGGIPLVKSMITSMSDRVEMQMAHLYFFYNFLSGMILLQFLRPSMLILEKLWPPSMAEQEARLKYINDYALDDPDSALDLAVMEQKRLITIMLRYIEVFRNRSLSELSSMQGSFSMVAKDVNEFLNSIGEASPSPETYERLNLAINNHRMIRLIEETVSELTSALSEGSDKSALAEFKENVVEAIDTLLLTMSEAVKDDDDFSRSALIKMTGDQNETMRILRDTYLSDSEQLDSDEKLLFFRITNICERLFWLIHSYLTRI